MSTAHHTPQEQTDALLELERHLQEVMDYINSVKSPSFGHVRLRITKHVQQDLNWIAAMTGNTTANSGSVNAPVDLLASTAPKMIMGKAVGGNRKPVTMEDTKPNATEKARFANSVDDLYNGFLGLRDNDLLAIIAKPGGGVLLKGVAKKANVPNWNSIDDSEMDTAFFADIREGIKENAKDAALTASLNKKVAEVDAPEEAPAVAKKTAAKKAVAPKKSAGKKAGADLDQYK